MNFKESYFYFKFLTRRIKEIFPKGFLLLYKLKNKDISIAVNPKSGVSFTRNLLKKANLDYQIKRIKPSQTKNFKSTFFVFRNPYNRSVSMYLRLCNLLGGSRGELEEYISKKIIYKSGYKNGISFNQFLEFISNTKESLRDIHYHPQYKPFSFKAIINTENYFEDLLKNLEYIDKDTYMILKSIDVSQISKNRCAINEINQNKDLSNISSNLIIKYAQDNSFPIKDNFLNYENLKLIENIFRNDINFAKLNKLSLKPVLKEYS